MSRTNSIRVLGRNFDTEAFVPLTNQQIEQSRQAEAAHKGRSGDVLGYGWWSPEIAFWMVIIPIVVLLFLLAMKPDFVKCQEDEDEYNCSRLFLWTLVISLIIWVILVVFRRTY